jgi:hypothetical protein
LLENGIPWETVGGLSAWFAGAFGWDFKELSEINYLGLLVARMPRTAKVSVHEASSCFEMPPAVADASAALRTSA